MIVWLVKTRRKIKKKNVGTQLGQLFRIFHELLINCKKKKDRKINIISFHEINLGLHVLLTCDRANVGTHECLNPYYGEVICTKTKSQNMVVPVGLYYLRGVWILARNVDSQY